MKTIQFLSASDRLNYGDLLFPIVTKTILSQEVNIDFKNYALIDSDLSHFGALPTYGYRKFEKENNENSVVVIGGGHVLFAHWNTLYGHINKYYLKSRKIRIVDWLYQRLGFPRILFTKSKAISPYAPYHLKGDLVYLSVGGNYNDHFANPRITKMLRDTALLSVRDKMLYNQFVKKDIEVYNVPDTAVLISKLFPKNDLLYKVSNKSIFDISQKYIIVQLGLHKGPTDSKRFIQDVNLFKDKGYKILCMPIGLAADHEDYKVLLELVRKDNSWNYYCPENIYEIMYLISNADWFLGTSLHGCITAFAYNTPFVPLNKKVKKLNNYTKTWWNTFIEESIDYKDLEIYLKKSSKLWDKSKALKTLETQQGLVLNNYNHLLSILNRKPELNV